MAKSRPGKKGGPLAEKEGQTKSNRLKEAKNRLRSD